MPRLSIPDMSCNHCKASVTAALTTLPGVTEVSVDLQARTADVRGDATLAAILVALEQAGYPASPA